MTSPDLSLVLPIYNEEAVIPELDRRLKAVFAQWEDLTPNWEVIFVNDGSSDASLEMLRKLAAL
jgi:polyisoprenyl-phosphate glycosyltransferase